MINTQTFNILYDIEIPNEIHPPKDENDSSFLLDKESDGD